MMMLTPVIVAVEQDAPPRSPLAVQHQRHSARLALAHCVTRCGAPVRGWEQDAAGVPLPNNGHYWSISHERKWATAVIAHEPVGIDIEHIKPRDRELHEALAERMEWVVMGVRSWHSFFRLWTAKEATLKANGVGIGELLACRLLEVRDEHHLTLEYRGRPWHVEQFYHADHVTAVTCDAAEVDWCVLQ
jgi:4'-phosphopantetheinyl transferase